MVNRCEKAGFKCDGPQSIVFVQGKIVKSRRSQKLKTKAADPPLTTAWKRQEVEESTSESPEYRFDLPEIRPKFNDKEVYICYARRHLLPNGPIDLGLQELQTSDIVTQDSAAEGSNSSLFVQAALSFATLFFGAQHHQSRILTEGYAIHGVALKRLNQALSQPERRTHDDVIVSVILLAMLELFMPTGPRNWLKHMLGLEQLLALLDPASLVHASFRRLELYKGVRHMILIASLRNRTPSIFARQQWKAVLRTALSLETPEEQDLHDVLADCSVLIAASDELFKLQHTSGPGYAQRRQEMQCKAEELLVFLEAWKLRWDSNEGNVYIEEECLDLNTAEASPRIIYRFMSDSVARMLMLYNTALIYALRVMATLEIKNEASQYFSSDMHGYAGADIRSESSCYPAIRAAGLDIARCITDYLQHKRVRGETDFASPIVQWAVMTAGQALGGEDSSDGEWMISLLKGDAMYAIAKRAWEV
ncbi:hypothetical protein J4E93_000157 [Alternaria ventricosa]|uniref:uncharacterized protein n=1 Tax=Alternaria ventricosa TaxID=1187951 RepID=UPI0020C3E081|nr:uncharacterized protein J4E93_000157 [Alternaria ventricosa]KAI4655445.1 hypothetical protein J4E93_000157 [Alternaria ventricosa]